MSREVKDPTKRQERRLEQERRARTILRRVDAVLRTEGSERALELLTKLRLEAPLIPTTSCWFNRYRDMLLLWFAKVTPELEDEFSQYGFRRARSLARRSSSIVNDRLESAYMLCEKALEDMAERSRVYIFDKEGKNIGEMAHDESDDDLEQEPTP
jgi:hypothetical protein